VVFGFVPCSKIQSNISLKTNSYDRIRAPFVRFARDDSNDEEEDDDDDDDIDLSDQDWRAFRAKLVMQKPEKPASEVIEDEGDLDGIGSVFSTSTSTTEQEQVKSSSPTLTPLDPSQWAYDSGNVIETGAVILGGVEQDYGFGLRQQYFHKAAILVLDHEESTFTKGIILNRPSDLTLDDDLNEGVKWRVWFGGDVQGLESNMPEIVCLHSLKEKEAVDASIPVMKDIQWTSFENAKKLVHKSVASPSDFWVFCGYAGWGPGQLMEELGRKSWYMVATDSQTLLQELAKQADGADPRDAGLDTWDLLMRMIGRGETADEYTGDFDDLILKEWAREHLLSSEAGGGAGGKDRAPDGVLSSGKIEVDRLMDLVSSAAKKGKIKEGTLLRGTSIDRSPFLLDDQALHKSIVLIVGEDENITVGIVLNRPAAKGLDMQIRDKGTGKTKTVTLPLRYGGQYRVKGQDPLLWLHCNPRLRAAEIGSPIGPSKGSIYKCSSEQVTSAIGQGLAKPEDFLVVSGVTVWTERELQGKWNLGNMFEVIPDSQVHSVWDTLKKQEVLTKLNLVSNLAIADEAWKQGEDRTAKNEKRESEMPIGGLGEGFDEEDDSLVFKSDVKVSNLSDTALRNWVTTFLLGAPGLGD
jgi:putative AlgH/UPF0301 family transcriptional regulator